MVDQHLLEFVEDFALVAAEANECEDVLQGGRRGLVANATLKLGETVRIECEKNILERMNEWINEDK